MSAFSEKISYSENAFAKCCVATHVRFIILIRPNKVMTAE